MLIGVSGKIGSGKDTIGKIIQYLVWKSRVEKGELPLSVYSFSDFARETSFGKNQSNFEIKKYADKLKDFICMLIGCTREQLEDQEFKNKELPEEWWVYKIKSSNDDEDDYILGGYEEKDYLLADHNLDVEEWNELHGDFCSEMTEEEFDKEFLIKTTPRLLLQIIGTECIRFKVHPNAWVNALFADYKAKWIPTGDSVAEEDVSLEKEYPNWIITDVRFDNELEAVKSRGGISIRVHRDLYKGNAHIAPIPHESETALDNAEFDYVIENDSTIEDLIHTVSLILKKEKII